MPNPIDHISPVVAPGKSAPAVRPHAPVAVAHTEVTAEKNIDSAAVKQAAEQINEFIKSSSRNLQFSVDKGSGRIIVKVTDQETGEVIRQVPAEETLAIARSLDTPQGVIIRSKA